MRWALTGLLLLLTLSAAGSLHAAEESSVRRFAFIVGANDGGGRRILLRYADDDAQAVANVLEDLGGISPKDRVLLIDPDRNEFFSGLQELETRMRATRRADERQEVFVYYSGHSDEEGLLLYGRSVRYQDLRKRVEALPAAVRVIVLDSCSSGAMTRSKGGVTRPPFLSDASISLEGHAFLTSASADEAAQESDRIEGSFFTHYLVSGLRGAADVTGDRRVTLNEAYQYAFNETLGRTETTQSGAQHPSYDIQLSGTGELVLTELRENTASLLVEGGVAGRLYLRDANMRLVAEVGKSAGRPMELGIEPGNYRMVLERDGAYSIAEFNLEMNRPYMLALNDFTSISAESTVARGRGDEGKKYKSVPFNIGFFPPADINKAYEDEGPIENNVSLGLFANEQDKLRGFGLAGFLNWQNDDMAGLQLTSIVNVTQRDALGVSVAGIVNVAQRDSKGLQLAGIYNHNSRHFMGAQYGLVDYTGGNFTGAQLALVDIAVGNVTGAQLALTNVTIDHVRGAQLSLANVTVGNVTGAQFSLANVTYGDFIGAQLALASVVAGDATGLQYSLASVTTGSFTGLQAGYVNITTGREPSAGAQMGFLNVNVGRLRGAQLGFINYAEDVDAPIGFLSIVPNGQVHGQFWTSDTALVNAAFKHGSKYVYNLFALGLQPLFDTRSVSFGWGIGGHIPLTESWFLDIDTLLWSQMDMGDTKSWTYIDKLRFVFGWKWDERRSIIFGPTLSLIHEQSDNAIPIDQVSYLPHWKIYEKSDKDVVRLGPGFILGVEI